MYPTEKNSNIKPFRRIFAFGIDFILTKLAINWTIIAMGFPTFYAELAFLLLHSCYFILSYSYIMKGQTLGKFLTGLQVLNRKHLALNENDKNLSYPTYLSIRFSALRYFILYGIAEGLMLLPDLYRYHALVLHPIIQNANAYLCIGLILANLSFWLITSFKCSLHDLAASSYVIRKRCNTSGILDGIQNGLQTKTIRIKFAISCSFGVICTIAVGTLHTDNMTSTALLLRYRYKIENTFQIRIAIVSTIKNNIPLIGVRMETNDTVPDSWSASNLTKYSIEIGAIDVNNTKKIEWIFSRLQASRRETSDELLCFSVDTATLETIQHDCPAI